MINKKLFLNYIPTLSEVFGIPSLKPFVFDFVGKGIYFFFIYQIFFNIFSPLCALTA